MGDSMEEQDTGLINATTTINNNSNTNTNLTKTTTHPSHNNSDYLPNPVYFVSALEGRVLGGSLSGPIQTGLAGLGGGMVRNHSFNSSHGSGSGSSSDIESRHRVDCDEDSVGGDDSVVSPSIWQRLALFSSPIKKKDKHYQQQASLTTLSESNGTPGHDHHRMDHRIENLSGSNSHNNALLPDHNHDIPSALDDPTRPLLHPTPNQKGML